MPDIIDYRRGPNQAERDVARRRRVGTANRWLVVIAIAALIAFLLLLFRYYAHVNVATLPTDAYYGLRPATSSA